MHRDGHNHQLCWQVEQLASQSRHRAQHRDKEQRFDGCSCLPDLPSCLNEVHDRLPLRTQGHKARLSILWESYLSRHNAGRFPQVTTSGQNVGQARNGMECPIEMNWIRIQHLWLATWKGLAGRRAGASFGSQGSVEASIANVNASTE